MAEELKRVGVAVTIRLRFSTDFIDESQAQAGIKEIVDAALREVENEVDNEYVIGVYHRSVEAVEMETFRLLSE